MEEFLHNHPTSMKIPCKCGINRQSSTGETSPDFWLPSTVGLEDSMPFDQVPVRCRLSGSEYDFASGIGSKGEIPAVGSRTGVGCLKKSPEFMGFHTSENQPIPWKMLLGRGCSFWNGLFSGESTFDQLVHSCKVTLGKSSILMVSTRERWGFFHCDFSMTEPVVGNPKLIWGVFGGGDMQQLKDFPASQRLAGNSMKLVAMPQESRMMSVYLS